MTTVLSFGCNEYPEEESRIPLRDLMLACDIRQTIYRRINNIKDREDMDILNRALTYFQGGMDAYTKFVGRPEQIIMQEQMREVAIEIFEGTPDMFMEISEKVVAEINEYKRTLEKMFEGQYIELRELKKLDYYFERLAKLA